jgi:hypothetical protein
MQPAQQFQPAPQPGPLNKPLLPPNIHGQAQPWGPAAQAQGFVQQQPQFYGPPQQQYAPQFQGQPPPSLQMELNSRQQMQQIQSFLDSQPQPQPPQYAQYQGQPQQPPQFQGQPQQPPQFQGQPQQPIQFQAQPQQFQQPIQFVQPQTPPVQQFDPNMLAALQQAFAAAQVSAAAVPAPAPPPPVAPENPNQMDVTPGMVSCAKEIHGILNLVQKCSAILQGPKLSPTSELNVPGLATPVTPPQLEATVQNLLATASQHMRQLDELIASNNPRFDPELQKLLASTLVENDGKVPARL